MRSFYSLLNLSPIKQPSPWESADPALRDYCYLSRDVAHYSPYAVAPPAVESRDPYDFIIHVSMSGGV